jgi:uncharacterized membrane protein YkvA (DUF1232 family)
MKITKESVNRVVKKIGRFCSVMGQQTVYSILLMVYAFRRKDVPGWAKRIIIGALGYVLTPIDAIPDLTPVIGYTDDLGVLSFGLVAIASYINLDVRVAARRGVKSLFGKIDLGSLQEIDSAL